VSRIDPSDPRPPAEQIAGHLRAQIDEGELSEGDRLPTTNQLMETYEVAYNTARRAVAILVAEGLVDARQGFGSRVRQPKPMIQIGTGRYSRRVRQGGQAILQAEAAVTGVVSRQELRQLGEVPAPDWVAAAYGIEPGAPVFLRARTELLDDEPSQLADSYYLLDLVAEAPALGETSAGPGGGFARIEDAGWALAEFEERLHNRPARPAEVSGLQLPKGIWVTRKHRFVWAERGGVRKLVEAFETVMRADRIESVYRFPAPE
jgi:GntR family transcriptional regulator